MKINMTKDELLGLVRQNLRRLREQAGLTQSELARRANMTPGWINDLEHGRRCGISVTTLAPICEALGVHPCLLLMPEELSSGISKAMVTPEYRALAKQHKQKTELVA